MNEYLLHHIHYIYLFIYLFIFLFIYLFFYLFSYLFIVIFFLSTQDPATNTYWMIYDEETGELTPLGVDSYKPQDGSTTIFKLETRVNNECATAAETESPTDQD